MWNTTALVKSRLEFCILPFYEKRKVRVYGSYPAVLGPIEPGPVPFESWWSALSKLVWHPWFGRTQLIGHEIWLLKVGRIDVLWLLWLYYTFWSTWGQKWVRDSFGFLGVWPHGMKGTWPRVKTLRGFQNIPRDAREKQGFAHSGDRPLCDWVRTQSINDPNVWFQI